MRTGHERAHGPYKHGNKWRVVFVTASGTREVESYESFERACEAVKEAQSAANSRTLGEAVRDYLEQLGGRDSSRTTARHRLVAILGLVAGDRLLSTLTPAVVRKLVADRQKAVAFETIAGELRYAGRFASWAVEQGWLRANPFTGIELRAPQEGRSRGKPQLRVNEVRTFLTHVLANDTREATAVLVAVLMGLRAHEIVERVVRDLDDDGRLLHIGKSKTRAGERIVAVPQVLQERLRELAAGKAADARIFPFTRRTLHYHVVALAKAAGVPRVTPHGLRGTYATMALTASLPESASDRALTLTELVRTVGHSDTGSTLRRHYLAPGAEESVSTKAVEGFLKLKAERNESVSDAHLVAPEGNGSSRTQESKLEGWN